MMLTEEQARTKLCPHMRVCINANDVWGHRHEPVYENHCCVASECNAWRWRDYQSLREDRKAAGEPLRGFCGLAGRPED